MRIYVNRRPTPGPWGGGSKILSSIVQEAITRGHDVFLAEDVRRLDKVDVIMSIDPRDSQDVSAASVINLRNRSNCPWIQRVGDVGTHGKPELTVAVEDALRRCDVAVFPSEWARSYVRVPESLVTKIIWNRPLPDFVGRIPRRKWMEDGVLRVVTHHWSDNSCKGHDIYEAFSKELSVKHGDVQFTFIGRRPKEVRLSREIPPLDVPGLVEEIPRHDVYLTASRLEAGANHVLEAMGLGLPVLYRSSGGSIVEYCMGRGIMYRDVDHLVSLLEEERDELQRLRNDMTLGGRLAWLTTSQDTARQYVDLLEETTK